VRIAETGPEYGVDDTGADSEERVAVAVTRGSVEDDDGVVCVVKCVCCEVIDGTLATESGGRGVVLAGGSGSAKPAASRFLFRCSVRLRGPTKRRFFLHFSIRRASVASSGV